MLSAMHRQVALLATAQGLFQTASAMVITVAALAGAHLAPPGWTTAPVAAMFLGTAVATAPAAIWMNRAGRRAGFIAGALFGALGGALAATGLLLSSFLLLCAGIFFVGCYQGFAQFQRFAAAEIATDDFRPRAISLVLAGGVAAALAGPALGRLGSGYAEPPFTLSFAILSILSLLAAVVLLGLKMPPPREAAATGAARPLGVIVRQPAYLVALFGALTGYGVMILAMTATPLAMAHHHHDLAATALVIQLHGLGMFVPSFFTGSLIARFGVLRIMLAGLFLLAAHIVLSLSGTGFYSFTSALIALGVGWNFLFIGGTTLLTRTYTEAEKGKAQAANDMTIFVVGLAASLSAGALQETVGWQMLNVLLLPWLAIAALAVFALAAIERRAAGAVAGAN